MSFARIRRGLSANIYDKLVIAGVQLGVVPVFAISWGLQVYGGWVLLATIPSFLSVSDFGFATAAGTKMTMLAAKGKREEVVRVFQSAWAMVLASSLLMCFLALTAALFVPDTVLPISASFQSNEVRMTLVVLLIYGIVSLQGSIFMAGFRCAGHYATGVFWFANTVLFENTAAVLIVIAGGRPLQAASALLICRSAALIIQNILLRRRAPWLKIGLKSAKMSEVKDLFAPALAIAALPLAQASFLQGTALALGIAVSEAAVPAFTATRTLSRIGLQMTQLLTHALMPEFSAAFARGDRPAQGQMVVATILVATIVSVPYALILAVAGPKIVELWTHNVIHPPEMLMVVMAMTVVLGGIWNPLSNLILAMNRHASFSYPFVMFAILTMPLSYGLSAMMGAAGAGLAIALMDMAMCIVIFRLGRRLFVSRSEMRVAACDIGERVFSVIRRK